MSPLDFTSLLRARAIDRRRFLRGASALGAGAAAIYAVGCGSGDDDDGDADSPTATAASSDGTPSGDIRPVLITSEFVAAQDNRFAVGLLRGGDLVKGASVHARFFTIGEDGTTGTLRGESDMTSNVLTPPEGSADSEEIHFYTLNTQFDVPGRWGVELTVAPDDGSAETSAQVPLQVLTESVTPAIGAVPPASQNDTTATNSNTESLCTRSPACELHDLVIADVLGKGRPLVVQFSTPAYCETRFCGPVLDVLLEQVPPYRDRIDFVHIEIWQDFQLQQQRQAVREWNLPTEPYTFFMAGDGRVTGKLEAVFTAEELGDALSQLAAL